MVYSLYCRRVDTRAVRCAVTASWMEAGSVVVVTVMACRVSLFFCKLSRFVPDTVIQSNLSITLDICCLLFVADGGGEGVLERVASSYLF